MRSLCIKLLMVLIVVSTFATASFACYQCGDDYQCWSGYNYGGSACQSTGTGCLVWIPCASYEQPKGEPTKVLRASCKSTLLPNGQRVSIKRGAGFKQFVNAFISGEFSGEDSTLFMGKDLYRQLPVNNWTYVGDKEVTYARYGRVVMRGRIHYVTTSNNQKVRVVVID